MPSKPTFRTRGSALIFSAVWLGGVSLSRGDVAAPAYSSRPGAPYTIYLDFGGFSYTGSWLTGETPGVTAAFAGATGAFTAGELTEIQQLWASIADTYMPFNVNVTTVDPAVAAGDAGTDLQRQNYYDSTPQLMHTVIGGTGSWTTGAPDGLSAIGATSIATPGTGAHTNWVFPNAQGITLSFTAVATAADHENGHGFGLQHQNSIGATSAEGTLYPIMSAFYNSDGGADRHLFANGPAVGVADQNDDEVIANNPNMGGFVGDGIGHSIRTATPLGLSGGGINVLSAQGVIVPASSSNPVASGSGNYVSDYFSFTTAGGVLNLTANSGGELITPGTADPNPSLDVLLNIYNTSGTLVLTSSAATLSKTVDNVIKPGSYLVQVTATGDAVDKTIGTTFFDQGPYFLSGTVPNPVSVIPWASQGGGTWSAASNWNPALVPQLAGLTVSFANSITASAMVTLDANWTVGSIVFDNPTNSYTLAPGNGGSLTLNNPGTRAAISVGSGSHVISAPLALESVLNVAMNGTASALNIQGAMSGADGIRVTGPGVLTLSGSNTYAGITSILSGHLVIAAAGALPATSAVTIGVSGATATMQLAGGGSAFTLASLSVGGGSTLDVGANKVVINYGQPSADPEAALVASLVSGANSGVGILSSTSGLHSTMFRVGYLDGDSAADRFGKTVAPNQFIIQYALAGDSFLEGSVGFDDLAIVGQNFGKTGEDWAGGNFVYDPTGSVGFADLAAVAQNFGRTGGLSGGDWGVSLSPLWLSAPKAVPEPGLAGMAVLTAGGMILRRKRKSK